MPYGFLDIVATPNAHIAGRRWRCRVVRAGRRNRAFDCFGPTEEAFIAARESFPRAGIPENGWRHVPHRGGPAGFVKILDVRFLWIGPIPPPQGHPGFGGRG